MSRLSNSQLIDRMAEVADRGRTPWARRFATSMCKASLRPGWKPTPKQRRAMGWAMQQWVPAEQEDADDDFDLFEPYDA